MKIQVPEQIRTERLLLRRHSIDDLPGMLGFISDREATKHLIFTNSQKSREGVRDMLEMIIASYETDEAIFSLTIAEPESGRFIGFCGMGKCENEGEMEVFYNIIPEMQGHGFATEALKALVEHASCRYRPHRLIAIVMGSNLASIGVARKAGFSYGGPAIKQGRAGMRYVLELV